MAIKVNQSKQYRIYIKGSKSWVDVNKEFYTNYYRDINAYRKRQQEHGRCVCPASKRYLCDMDCMTCPYAKAGDQLSLDNTVSDGEGNEKSWLDDMPDESAAIAELMEDTFFVAVYGFIIYNVGKIILYLVRYAVYHIRRDINKYKSNKDKQ